jgi:hypothetical protein
VYEFWRHFSYFVLLGATVGRIELKNDEPEDARVNALRQRRLSVGG